MTAEPFMLPPRDGSARTMHSVPQPDKHPAATLSPWLTSNRALRVRSPAQERSTPLAARKNCDMRELAAVATSVCALSGSMPGSRRAHRVRPSPLQRPASAGLFRCTSPRLPSLVTGAPYT